MIFAGQGVELEVCFIRRAERRDDPWSGQVAFPGGRASETDHCEEEVAERETFEEVGLILSSSDRVGQLPVRDVRRDDLRHGLTLTPVLYHIAPERCGDAIVKGKDEVASVFWVPLRHLFDVNAITSIDYKMAGSNNSYPGIRYQDDVIWGLTLRILESFATLVGRDFPAMRS